MELRHGSFNDEIFNHYPTFQAPMPSALTVHPDCRRRKPCQRRGSPCDFGEFDVIISNPPYVAQGCRSVNRAAKFDPKVALYCGRDGLDYYRQIARIKNGKRIYLEIGMGQHDAVREIFEREGWKFVAGFNDLTGIVRVQSYELIVQS